MAYTKKTLQDLLQSLADKHDGGDLTTDTTTLSYWKRLLNRGKDYCAEQLGIIKRASITVTSGTYTLPDDFISLVNVTTTGGVELTLISQPSSEGASGLVYWISGNHSAGFILNIPTDDTYYIYYTYRVEDMSATTDVCLIPDPEAVVCHAYYKLRKSETDPFEDAQESLDECNERLNTLRDAMQENDAPIMFRLPDEGPSVTSPFEL